MPALVGKADKAAQGRVATGGDSTPELRYAMAMLQTGDLMLGGVNEQYDIDTSIYRWTEDDLGARWQLQGDKALRAAAQEWLTVHAPDKVTGFQPKSCIDVLVNALIYERRYLSRIPEGMSIVPLRNAYLVIEADGAIRATVPDRNLGIDYAIQTDLDWARVKGGFYEPSLPNDGGYWSRYLSATFVDSGVHDFTQEALSSILLTRCYEKGIWLYGNGENGKSVMLHVLRSLAPQHTAAVSLKRLTKDQFGTGVVNGKRLVLVSEMPSRLEREMQTVLKGLISWDPTSCERKGKDEFTFTPRAVWIFATNHHPDISDHEHGFHRKIDTIPFTNRVATDQKIYDFHKLIVGDPVEMAQVIDWLLIGAARLTKRGRWLSDDEKPEAMKVLARQQRRETDTVVDWLHEVDLVYDASVLTGKQEIYEHYTNYVIASGKKAVARNKLWVRLADHFRGSGLESEEVQKTVNGARMRFVPLFSPDIRCAFPRVTPAIQQVVTVPAPATSVPAPAWEVLAASDPFIEEFHQADATTISQTPFNELFERATRRI